MRKVRIFSNLQQAFDAVEEGKARRLVIGDLKICLARHRDQFFAIEDGCPHSTASLSQGWVNSKGEMVCPLHNYCYDLGNGREFQEKTRDVITYRTIQGEEGLYIELT